MTAEVRISKVDWHKLTDHLFPGDHGEHGAVLRCGVAWSGDDLILLVNKVVPARDGSDYVPGTFGYRALTADFVGDNIDAAAESELAYIAVHNHGGTGAVSFSSVDLDSHERGYPALLQYLGGHPVGALVLSEGCVDGDIWLPDGRRVALDRLVVVGQASLPRSASPDGDVPSHREYDRQTRMFGDAGQARLGRQVVAIVGLGGVGSIVAELLARLGVSNFVLIDPDVVEVTNLSRLVGAIPADSAPRWRFSSSGLRRGPAFKVDVAARLIRQANPRASIERIASSVVESDVAARLKQVDHIFLAADTAQARLVVNAVAHQYFVSATQIGSKVASHQGQIDDVFSVVRAIGPDIACLNCNGLISAAQLQMEATSEVQRERQRYVDDEEVHAPSVVSLNALGAAIAVNRWMLSVTGLDVSEPDWTEMHFLPEERVDVEPRRDSCM